MRFYTTLQLAILSGLFVAAAPLTASAICVAKAEEGRWRNPDSAITEPVFVEVRAIGCPDVVLNGQTTPQTRYMIRVWLRQSSGALYGRPAFEAHWMKAKNKVLWLTGHVSTGGYDNKIWVRAADYQGKKRLNYIVLPKSLDSKPDGPQQSFWLVK